MIRVGLEDFDVGAELARLEALPGVGGVASFTGVVRDHGDAQGVVALELEHYPGMTERELAAIEEEAVRRWRLSGSTIIHRIGRLALGERIVLVATAAARRRAALEATEFLIDYLKTRAPFWKREITADGQRRWVEAKAGDDEAASRWT